MIDEASFVPSTPLSESNFAVKGVERIDVVTQTYSVNHLVLIIG